MDRAANQICSKSRGVGSSRVFLYVIYPARSPQSSASDALTRAGTRSACSNLFNQPSVAAGAGLPEREFTSTRLRDITGSVCSRLGIEWRRRLRRNLKRVVRPSEPWRLAEVDKFRALHTAALLLNATILRRLR